MTSDKKATTKAVKRKRAPKKPPAADPPEELDRETLMKKAYRRVAQKLEDPEANGKAIDDLVKLVKLEKDLGEEQDAVKEIKVRWEPSEDESSSER